MNGFFRIAACSPESRPGAISFNVARIVEAYLNADASGAAVIVFPELAVTGFSCGDFFKNRSFIESAESALGDIAAATAGRKCAAVCGLALRREGKLFDAAAVIAGGRIAGFALKESLSAAQRRFFSPASALSGGTVELSPHGSQTDGAVRVEAGADILFSCGGLTFGVEIGDEAEGVAPPSLFLAASGAHAVLNPCAPAELAGAGVWRRTFASASSARIAGVYVSAAAGVGDSSGETVFAGRSLIAFAGRVLAESEPMQRSGTTVYADVKPAWCEALRQERPLEPAGAFFATDVRRVAIGAAPESPDFKYAALERHPFVPAEGEARMQRCAEILAIQTVGLATRWERSGAKRLVVGLSGGLDSTLAAIVCAKAADWLGRPRSSILALTMPGFGTTSRTRSNAGFLAKALGAEFRTVSIAAAVEQHFKDIGHDPAVRDVTYENAQARERTQILMDVANDTGGLVVGTGDLSEIALGWCTYNGDQMAMYSVNGAVPKTLMRHIVGFEAENARAAGLAELASTLRDIAETPVSPELLPGGAESQKTEGILGKYDLHDFFLYHFVKWGESRENLRAMAVHAFAGIAGEDEIERALDTFLGRFVSQQFKRDASPIGPAVGSVSLSAHGAWCAPADFPAVF